MEAKSIQTEKSIHPKEHASFFSSLTFLWMLPIFKKTSNYFESLESVYEPLKEDSSKLLGDEIEKQWNNEIEKSRQRNKKPNLIKVFFKLHFKALILSGLMIFTVEFVFRLLTPVCLIVFISYFNDKTRKDVSKEMFYASTAGLILAPFLTVFINHAYHLLAFHVGMKSRIAISSLMYRKVLKVKKSTLNEISTGHIINLFSNDAGRFDYIFSFFFDIWIGPIQILIIAYCLWMIIGVACFVGIFVIILSIPLTVCLGKVISVLRLHTASRTDDRVRIMSEITQGIQIIKMYVWEKPFGKLVEMIRRKELNIIKKLSYIRGILSSLPMFHTRFAVFITLITYVVLGNTVTASKAFVLTAFFNVLQLSVADYFPLGASQISEFLISLKRIENFLLVESNDVPTEKGPESNSEVSVMLSNVYAKWSNEGTQILSNISLEVNQRELVAIIGSVGSGKSSLLSTILKELIIHSGTLQVSGKVSYASQEPWLFPASIKENIIFGEEYNEGRFKKVVKACALDKDLDSFVYRERTIVGERGVTLSGGQKARISLARALYKDADIYLLDDPLSAVDATVQKHLFEECIKGALREKIVILITHQVQYLKDVKKIVAMENGSIQFIGNYDDLLESGIDFSTYFREKCATDPIGESISSNQNFKKVGEPEKVEENEDEELIEVEMIHKSNKTLNTFWTYLKKGGNFCVLGTLIIVFISAQAVASGGDYWTSYWVVYLFLFTVKSKFHFYFLINFFKHNNKLLGIVTKIISEYPEIYYTCSLLKCSLMFILFPRVNLEDHVYMDNNTQISSSIFDIVNKYPSREICLYIFTALILANIILSILRSTFFFSVCIRISQRLHNEMFTAVSRSPLRFFNENHSGRIINRFSKDIGNIDEVLPNSLISCLQIILSAVGVFSVVPLANVWLLVPTFAMLCIFYLFRKFYLASSCLIKRIEGTARSPVYTHLNSSLQGLTTVHALQAQTSLTHEFDKHQDKHTATWYTFIAAGRAIALWLDIVCAIYNALVTISFISFKFSPFGGNVGLAITQTTALTSSLQWGMRQSAEVENHMTSVERLLEYTKLEEEKPIESSPENKPHDQWPFKGKISFRKVFLRYSPRSPWVLHDLSFTILPGQKVGVVGRTGAGKSSIIAALFRLFEVKGQIEVDEIDTSSIGLWDLRTKISVIPQDPVLFTGTLRYNLDPFDKVSDDILWQALEKVNLVFINIVCFGRFCYKFSCIFTFILKDSNFI
uniref:ATP-dependent bile acid permease n=1 Tax=Riptortus pedestris TaxID=329032 RepID=R4WR65_RIPPE|nr:ATP-dependent bile acid permease [Riptortus pedestris]